MRIALNETHDPDLKCRVASAHFPGTDFPIQNLPFGVFQHNRNADGPHIGVAIGDHILDLKACKEKGLLLGLSAEVLEAVGCESLNSLMSAGRENWSALRQKVSLLLRQDAESSSRMSSDIEAALIRIAESRMLMPVRIGDYTDFYASIHHARNVGSMFRPENPLFPNYKYVPVGYHGRASSVVVSGTAVHRPCGQLEGKGSIPEFGPSRLLDYELEIGAFVGPGNALGIPIKVSDAESHIFGLCLVNDWSARDIQRWEYQPLGPFLAKSFATTISPWIVTMEALAPFRTAASPREPEDPSPLPYLDDDDNQVHGGVDLELQVLLRSEKMRTSGMEPVQLTQSSFKDMYWTLAQMLTHHASNGCNLRPGDLIASGTVSGREKGSRGCLLELTWRGTEPVPLPSGESRRFLEEGDEVVMRARACSPGFAAIGFGECRGVVTAPVSGW